MNRSSCVQVAEIRAVVFQTLTSLPPVFRTAKSSESGILPARGSPDQRPQNNPGRDALKSSPEAEGVSQLGLTPEVSP